MPEPTPGQVAYAAYEMYWYRLTATEAGGHFAQIDPRERDAWEAAAQAVLAQAHPQEPRLPRCRWCGQAQAAHPQASEPWQCRLSDGPLLPTAARRRTHHNPLEGLPYGDDAP